MNYKNVFCYKDWILNKSIPIFFFVFSLVHSFASAQQYKIDSLRQVIYQYEQNTVSQQDSSYVMTLNRLSALLVYSRPDSVFFYTEQAKYIADLINYKKGKTFALNAEGIAYYHLGIYNQSLKSYLESLELGESIHNESGVLASLNNIGNIYLIQKKYSEALSYYEKSLEKAQKLKDSVAMSNSYNNIGIVHKDLCDYEKALQYYFLSLKIDSLLKNEQGLSTCFNNLGLIFLEKKEYEKSLNYFLKSLEAKKKVKDMPGLSFVYNNMSELYYEKNDYNASIDLAEKALEIAENFSLYPSKSVALESLHKSYASKKDYKKAYDYLEKYNEVKDSTMNQEKLQEIERLQMKYEFDKQQEVAKLKQEEIAKRIETENKNKLKVQNFYTVALFIALILVLIFAFFMHQANQRNMRLNKILWQKQQEIITQKIKAEEVNEMLEQRVRERTISILKQNEKLRQYAHKNSHQVRGPLARIKGLIELYQKENDEQNKQTYITYIKKSSEELDNIIKEMNDILSEDNSLIW